MKKIKKVLIWIMKTYTLRNLMYVMFFLMLMAALTKNNPNYMQHMAIVVFFIFFELNDIKNLLAKGKDITIKNISNTHLHNHSGIDLKIEPDETITATDN